MNEDPVADPSDRPLMPPEPDSGMGALRWVVTGIALVLLVVGAWRAYEWFIEDVAQRRAAASGVAPTLQAPPGAQAPSAEPAAVPVPRTVQPPAPPPAPPPVASVVAGLDGVNKCVVDGQVTYTNAPCPAGATPEPPNTARAAAPDDQDAAGPDATGDAGAVRVARLPALGAAGDEPSQRASLCGYWTAEIERLDFEFKQPLPPPVLDRISTHLAELRGQFGQAKCGPLPKAAEDNASASAPPAPRRRAAAPKVVDERSDE